LWEQLLALLSNRRCELSTEVESTLNAAKQLIFRGRICKAVLKISVRKHKDLGKLLKSRRLPGYLEKGFHLSLGVSL